jgi:CYTH domain-containing protein
MAKFERERKFLVRGDGWRGSAHGVVIRQAYLSTDPDRTVRIRTAGNRAWLTIKGRARGAERAELEYEVPFEDAAQLFSLAVWEVDEFSGDNAGLVTAEIELADAQALERAALERPEWVGRELTADHRFSNSNLAVRPLALWPEQERAEALQ